MGWPSAEEEVDIAEVRRVLNDNDEAIRDLDQADLDQADLDLDQASLDLYIAIHTTRERSQAARTALRAASSVILDLLCERRAFLRD